MKRLMVFFKGRKKRDFSAKVLDRYASNKSVGSFSVKLFSSENRESINDRFASALRNPM